VVYQTPLLCVIEAKKDDFEKGLAQCLVEMEACRFRNKNLQPIDIYGIVTNSLTWRFYKFTVKNEIYESAPYAEQMSLIDFVFMERKHLLIPRLSSY